MKPTIDQLRNIGEILSTYRWDFEMVNLPRIGTYPRKEDISMRCESSEIPKATNEPLNVTVRGLTIPQNGVNKPSESITLTFIEAVDMTIHRFIREWRNACSDHETGRIGNPADVQVDILLWRLDGNDRRIWEYLLKGAFLMDYDLGSLNSETGSDVKPSMTLRYTTFRDRPL